MAYLESIPNKQVCPLVAPGTGEFSLEGGSPHSRALQALTHSTYRGWRLSIWACHWPAPSVP